MAGDARALLADGLLGNLHQNFLALFQQVADLRNLLLFASWESPSTTPASAPLPVKTGTRTRSPLRVTRRRSWRTNLSPCIRRACFPGLGGEQCFRLGLRFFQFQFFGVIFALGRSAFRCMWHAGFG